MSIDTPLHRWARSADPVNWRHWGAATIGHLHRAGWTMYMWPPPPSVGLRNFRSLVLMSSMGDEVLVHLAARPPRHRGRFHRHRYHFPRRWARPPRTPPRSRCRY